MKVEIKYLRSCAALLALALLIPIPAMSGENPLTNADARLVWPAAPAEARLAYQRRISGPVSLGVKPSGLGRLANWITGANKGEEALVKPFGLAIDDEDNLCVTDTGAAVVCYCDQKRKQWQRWDHIGGVKLVSPVAMAKQGGVFFVADSELAKVIAFRGPEKALFEITNGFERPSGLAILNQKLFVADAKAQCVSVFDLQGKFLFKFGKRGAGVGEFNFPTHLGTDPAGRLLVTDSMNSRIEVFDAEGKFQMSIGEAGDTAGHFARPKGSAVDAFGHIYVTDAMADNLQIFDSAGQLLLVVGETGDGAGQFWMPTGIAINRSNQVFVADSYNRRVEVFQYLGKP